MQQSNKSLNVTDNDKINIVSSQAVLEMSSFSVNTRSMSSSPLVNSLFKKLTVLYSTIHRWATVSIHPHYGFVCGRHDAAWQPRSRNPQDWISAVWRPQVGHKKVWRFLTQQFNCCTCAARCASALSCWNTLRRPIADSSMTSLWRHKAASKKSVRDITRISCFVTTMQLPHALPIYSTVFVRKRVCSCILKVVQQQTIGEVGNSITCLLFVGR